MAHLYTSEDLPERVLALIPHNSKLAVTQSELAEVLEIPDSRIVRTAIRELIAQGHPIASSTRPPYGYYLIGTPEEARLYVARLKSQIAAQSERIADFTRAANARLGAQIPLF